MSNTLFFAIGGGLVLLIVWIVATWNSFISSRNKVDESWSGIDVQLKRRHDLIPNLVEAVKGYAAHERATLTEVTEARAAAMRADDPADVARAEGALSSALAHVRALAEQYPELRAAENFQDLQRRLAQLEDEIQAARRIYNSNVQSYNTRVQLFPNSLLSGKSFPAREYFELDSPAERLAPTVSFA
jgi:LemA protein